MQNETFFTVSSENSGERIDKLIVIFDSSVTRSSAQRLIEQGNVKVNGKPAPKNLRAKEGDKITLIIPEPEAARALPENIPLNIVYEDSDLLVVNKPKGMVVHPAAGHYSGTLVNALLYHCGSSLSGINGVMRPGIVHRIDKDTSGLLIVAKNDFSHNILAEQIKRHSFTRKYQAVVCGNLKQDEETVNLPIGRSSSDRKKMAVTQKNSKNAVTHYRVIQRYNGFTHVELTLETGRTHQIRVHMSYIGHPVAGDCIYGGKNIITRLNGQCLHAYFISFKHPRTGEVLTFSSDLPEYFKEFLEYCERRQG